MIDVVDEYLTLQQKRRRARRFELRLPIGSIVCGLVLTYLMAAALVGILAGT